jgi:hypothetical protein
MKSVGLAKAEAQERLQRRRIVAVAALSSTSLILASRWSAEPDAARATASGTLAQTQSLTGAVEVAFTFDEHRMGAARRAILSLLHDDDGQSRLRIHVIAPRRLHSSTRVLAETAGQRPHASLRPYDSGVCRRLICRVWSMAEEIHPSVVCRLFPAGLGKLTAKRAAHCESPEPTSTPPRPLRPVAALRPPQRSTV